MFYKKHIPPEPCKLMTSDKHRGAAQLCEWLCGDGRLFSHKEVEDVSRRRDQELTQTVEFSVRATSSGMEIYGCITTMSACNASISSA
ncbi:unnamed protein product [Pleuronectes platessa]|uniref:Uncharacterized protein n=1 Tax=Pleuronectes platessa TaxID=8262 RepID=A0A9N7VDQ1_PLEPL|nr:unnamed protein product [Pleuronectes platessa]